MSTKRMMSIAIGAALALAACEGPLAGVPGGELAEARAALSQAPGSLLWQDETAVGFDDE